MQSRVNLPPIELGTPATPELLIAQYSDYQISRDALQALELQGGQPTSTALVATLGAKEQLAYTALALYSQARSTKEFEATFTKTVTRSKAAHEDALRMGIDDPLLGSYIHPLSLTSDRLVSPTEAIGGLPAINVARRQRMPGKVLQVVLDSFSQE